MVPPSPPSRQMALRTYLVLLIIGSMLPFLVVSGALLLRVMRDDRTSVERTLIGSAREQATALDSEMDATVRTLQSLAASTFLERDDLTSFETEVRRAAATQNWLAIRVLSPEPKLLIDTSEPPDEPSGELVDLPSIDRVKRDRRPTIAMLRKSESGTLAFAIRVPVLRDNQVRYILTAVVTPAAIADLMARESLPPMEWTRTIVDSQGMVVARTRDPEQFVGKPATPSFIERTGASMEGFYRDTALEGEYVYVAFSHARLSGWTSAIVVPVSFMDGPMRRSMTTLVAVALFGLVISGSGAYWLAGRISSDIGSATLAAEELARGKPVRATPSIVSDVTRLGQALERSGTLLTDRSLERDRNLAQAEAARAEAERANSAKDQFLAMLGHELRNPLSPIVTALALLKMRGTSWTKEHAVMERQVSHMSRLVNDLLDVSRITRRALDLRKAPLELADVITRATEMAAPRLEEHRHTLTVHVPDGLRVVGDEVRLAQVFGNLLSNAATYTPEGGSVSVRAEQHGSEIAIAVSDTGRGIAPDIAPRIFGLFVQGPRTIDRQEGGLGLGLAIARSLVELHDGRIEAHSDGIGKGSTFTVYLPACTQATAAVSPAQPQAPPPTRALKLLIVDDNPDAAEMLSMFLTGSGHEVVTASDGPRALEALRTFRPDIAVLDIGLPVMDGYELARRIREETGPAGPVLVAVTGYGQVEDVERSMAAGFAHHLVKPVDGDDLLRLFASIAG